MDSSIQNNNQTKFGNSLNDFENLFFSSPMENTALKSNKSLIHNNSEKKTILSELERSNFDFNTVSVLPTKSFPSLFIFLFCK